MALPVRSSPSPGAAIIGAQPDYLISGRYYDSRAGFPANVSAAYGTATVTANKLYGMPFYLRQQATLDQLSVEVVVSVLTSTSRARLGLYTATGGLPSTLIVDGGEITIDTLGVKTLSISETLAAGYYFLSIASDDTPGVAAHNLVAVQTMGFTTGSDIINDTFVTRTFTYAALPATFGGGLTFNVTNAPRIMFRIG